MVSDSLHSFSSGFDMDYNSDSSEDDSLKINNGRESSSRWQIKHFVLTASSLNKL